MTVRSGPRRHGRRAPDGAAQLLQVRLRHCGCEGLLHPQRIQNSHFLTSVRFVYHPTLARPRQEVTPSRRIPSVSENQLRSASFYIRKPSMRLIASLGIRRRGINAAADRRRL